MLFQVYTEEQLLDMRKEFETGLCDYAVQKADEGVSQSGNSYIKLEIRAFDKNGTERTVYDFLMGTESGAYKVRHFFYSCGLGAMYEAGKNCIPEELVGKQGKVKIVLRKEKDKDGNPIQRLRVEDYVPDNHAPKSAGDFDDDVPF